MQDGLGKETKREKITDMLEKVGKYFQEKRFVSDVEIYQGNDVHAFYRLANNFSQVMHVQGYPGISPDSEAYFWARLMDYAKMMELRKNPNISVGNEHEATIRMFSRPDQGFLRIPYDNSKALEEVLEDACPELKS